MNLAGRWVASLKVAVTRRGKAAAANPSFLGLLIQLLQENSCNSRFEWCY
ncbi:unnamed protein product [Brassica oleracea var. botrytis]